MARRRSRRRTVRSDAGRAVDRTALRDDARKDRHAASLGGDTGASRLGDERNSTCSRRSRLRGSASVGILMRHLEFDDERSRELVFDAVTVVRSLEELEAILLADPRSHRAFVDPFTDGQLARWLNAMGEFSRGSSVEQARRLSSRARNTAWKARVGKVFSAEAVAKLSASDVLGEVLSAKLIRKADAGEKVGLHLFRRHLEYNTPVAKPASRRPQKRRTRRR